MVCIQGISWSNRLQHNCCGTQSGTQIDNDYPNLQAFAFKQIPCGIKHALQMPKKKKKLKHCSFGHQAKTIILN